MALMGYTETDVFKMIEHVYKAYSLIEDKELKMQLIDTAGFLQGLLEEGRV